ncbi:MAG: aldolase [Actinomycetes bacterium]|jgi:class I fructose-bisphosphate aldolase|nr:aldolase [Actinomycetes bacterium]
MPKISAADVAVPADVSAEVRETYVKNYLKATRGTGRLMLFACDQKIEHLNDDFFGTGISIADAKPEHLFEIGSQGVVGILAGQRGLIAQYAPDYPDINYLVKMNSKTHLVKKDQDDPYSPQLYSFEAVLELIANGVNVVGIGYTIYLGSEYEAQMMAEAGELIAQAHAAGLIVVLWIYPRGKAVGDEKDAHLIAGAAGTALCLGSDFVKVNPPKGDPCQDEELAALVPLADGSNMLPIEDVATELSASQKSAAKIREASAASGRTGLVCAGGSTVAPEVFLSQLWDQIHIGGARGNATGRNLHQRSLDEAVRLTKAISAITLGDASVEEALAVFAGTKDFAL